MILSCCCKIIGCRIHILDLISNNNYICPECKKEIAVMTIQSLSILNSSIQTFIPQQRLVTSLMNKISTLSINTTSTQPEESTEKKESSSSRHRSRSRQRSHSHHHSSHHHDHSRRRY